ncbi:pseudouridine synthase [Stigmatella erecta]|uniref:Pseudouridine synthase n=1 Tax=Stigmatella erecta TaxID=83460 RepID=A0A1H9ZSM0_9BACT|nr:pseudouridine synthase [Stigmatella erecta]SES84700.1 23S rRNA pseudouridine2605 synthase [Stigmatella erecta]
MAERLQKYLARAGVASRRHAEELITAGRVMVNNQKVTELGSRVEPGTDLVSVDGELVSLPETSSYYLLYKPAGVVTTLSDPQGRPTVANYVESTGKRLFPVGRLDYDAEGALLFTDDGALAHKLTHPSFQVPRTYLAKVKGVPDRATLEKLRGGVRLEDGMATPLSVDLFEQAERNTWLKIVVAEGRPHLIKRLCAAVGHPVVRLFRPAYAGVGVSGVRPGELRALSATEVRLLQDVAEARTAPPEGELNLPPRRHGRAAPGFEADDDDEGFEVGDGSPASAKPAPARSASAKRAERKPAGKPARKEEGGSRLVRFDRNRPAAPDEEGDSDRPRRSEWKKEEGSARPERKSYAPRAEGAGRPERKSWAPRGESAGRPERKSYAPRGEGSERPERKSWAPRGEGAGRPERKPYAPRGEGSERPERKEWKPRAEGAGRPERKAWAPRGESAGRPERKPYAPRGEGSERPERKSWAPRGEGAGRPERKSYAPRGEGSERPERKSWAPRGEGAGRPERKPYTPRGEGSERPERREWKPRGESSERPERKPYAPRGEGAGRPERKSWAPRGESAGRPERKPYAPRGEGSERPERREWKPRGEGSERPRSPRFGGAAGADRPARRAPRAEGGEGGGKGFTDWNKNKKRGTETSWDSRRPSPAGSRGPRKPPGPRRPR